MRHAGPEALNQLANLLAAIRARGLKEPRPGTFYRKGRAWLHFHEDRAGLFADIRVEKQWERICVSDKAAQGDLLTLIDRSLTKEPQ